LLLGQTAQAFPQQNHDAHISIHMSLLNMPPVQMNAQVQALVHSHIMQHLQMKADVLGEQQMPPEVMQQFQQLQQQAQQGSRMYRWYELELLMKERELKKQQDKKDAENLA
jgi:hypothetical protein